MLTVILLTNMKLIREVILDCNGNDNPGNDEMRKQAQYISRITFHALRFSIFVLLLCLIACSAAQIDPQEQKSVIEQKAITHATTEKRLVSDNVRCIYASHGNIWVGTDRGLSVYHKADNRWKKLDREDGLISDDVTDIAINESTVWIGTRMGVSRYDVETESWTKFQKRDGIAHSQVNAVAVDGNYVWIGTENGISRYDTSTGAWASQIEKEKVELNAITAIAVETGYVWFGTRGGLRRYDKTKDAWNTYTEEEGLVENHVVCIALSPDAVWVGTEKSGVSKFSIANQTFTESHTRTDVLESDFIEAIVVDGDNVWFGSADRGIRRYLTTVDTWLKYTTEGGLISDHITDLVADGRDLWIGTAEGGLGRFGKVRNSWTWYSRKDSLASNQIHDLASSGDALWIGTNRGLSRYNPSNDNWTTYTKADGLVTNYITSVAVDRTRETVWVGTPLGLGVRQGSRWRFYTQRNGLASDFVTGVSIFGERVWAATRNGLTVLQLASDNRQSSVRSYLKDMWVTSVLVVGTNIWAGTTEGLYQGSSNTVAFEPYPVIQDYVNTLMEGSNGELLVGTRNGLWAIEDDAPRHITVGLPNLNVRSIAVDVATWVGTPSGVGRFQANFTTQEIITMQPDGLLHNNVQSIVVAGDRVFFGTVAGLAVWNKSTDRWTHRKPYYSTNIMREEHIRWMAKDGNHLWVLNWSASPNGAILKFDRRTDTWMTYTKESLPLFGASSLITAVPHIAVGEEEVWITTDHGMLQYNKRSDTWEHLVLGRRAGHVAIGEPHGIWVSLNGGGGAHYDRQTGQWETFYVVKPGDGGRVESVACTKDYVWFGTGEHGIRRYNWRTKKWKSYTEAQGLASRFGHWIVADGEDVWTGGGNSYSWIEGRQLRGVSRYRADRDTWIIYNERMGLRAANPRFGHISERYIWSYGWDGIDRRERSSGTWTSFTRQDGVPDWRVEAVAEDGDTFWVGTREKGVLRYYEASGAWVTYTTEDGLPSDEIRHYGIKVDPEYVWVGTGEGLSRYDKAKDTWVTFDRPETLASRRVVAVATDERYVWAGTHRGLSRYDKKYDIWRHFEKSKKEEDNEDGNEENEEEEKQKEKLNELVDNNVVDVSVGKRYVWIATEGGVGRYDKIAERFEAYTEENQLPSVDIRAIVENRSDVWIGTKNGVSKHNILSEDQNAWETYNSAIEITPTITQKYAKSLANDDVRCLAVDDHRVWVGTKKGVSVYDFHKETWQTFTRKDSLASKEVSCIGIDKTRVWFGSGHGVTVYDTATETWSAYTKADGLGSNLITSIAINSDQIWLGTFDQGVTVLDKATGKFTTFTKADGLPHNGILSIAIDGDWVWIGTHGGLTRYDTLTETWTVYTERFDHDGI